MGVSISVLRLDSGHRLKLVDSYPVVYINDRSKAVVAVLLLLFVALWLIIRGNFTLSLVLRFILVFFSPFSIIITTLCCFVVYSTRRFVLRLTFLLFCSCVFQSF